MKTPVESMNIGLKQFNIVPAARMSKRQQLASIVAATGAVSVLEKLPRRNCLVVLNYHRIGSCNETIGDPDLYSATPDDLDEQVSWIKQHYHICGLDEAIAFVEGRTTFRDAAILLTFDDGYKDNYDHAFPILRKHNVQGTFFICTSYIGSAQLPWWDRIAYMIKRSQETDIVLNYPERLHFALGDNKLWVLKQLLALYKSKHDLNKERFLQEIARATRTEGIRPEERIFINKSELKEMFENGMAIGSHTHSHPLLSHLSQDLQLQEVTVSKQILEQDLGIEVQSFAYPVGSPDSFDERTQEVLRRAGYRIAFSFYGGRNIANKTSPYDVCRHHVGRLDGSALFKLRTSTAAVVGKPLL